MHSYCTVFVTFPGIEPAREAATKLVEEKLCACASVSEGHNSFFSWKGKADSALEALMIIKTRVDRLEALDRRMRELHPYEVYEFIAMPIIYGNASYLAWIDENTRP
ncbi:MAG TPA: divalent-cation tolerance protein CutA [Candidatus Ozemobacteraceae bacterium]|nr:divalent-cation tolerance protein CutA [Candidatus Ozemobacteraceae bacterium]